MNFNDLLQLASDKQNDALLEKKIRQKTLSKPVKISKDRQKGVISGNVQKFLMKKEEEEKKKDIVAQKKKEELLKIRAESKHVKKANAMATRTKDNLQFYTKEKLDQFVAKEKEREQKQLEKLQRKADRQYRRTKRLEEGITRKRRTKYEIAKDKGLLPEPSKELIGVSIPKKVPKLKPRSNAPPPIDFNSLLKLASEKHKNTDTVKAKTAESSKNKPNRPMTGDEKERWLRRQSVEYKKYLKYGGKRPEFENVNNKTEEVPTSEEKEFKVQSKPTPCDIKDNSSSSSRVKEISTKILKSSKSIDSSANISRDQTVIMKNKDRLDISGSVGSKNSTKSSTLSKSPHSSKREHSNSSPREYVNETIIQCGSSKKNDDKRMDNQLKRKAEDSRENPFDRIMNKYGGYSDQGKRQRGKAVIESESEEEDSEMDDFIDDGEDEVDNGYSSAIKEIFGYDKSRYNRYEEDVSDMEANFADVMKEEARSAKIGLQEDLEDIRKEQEELKRKAERKKMLHKKMKSKKR